MSIYYSEDYLMHYGVIGMKWGVRRFQNPDGTLTTAGKKRYSSKTELRKDVKADNKKAKELGIQATVDTRAVGFAEKKYSKALKKYEKAKEKNPESKRTARLKRVYDAAKETRKDMIADRNKSVSEMNKHYQSLIKKYGKEYVKDIKYNKKGELREGRDAQKIAAQIVAYFGAASMAGLAGFGVAVAPKTTHQMANEKVMWKNYEHLKGQRKAEAEKQKRREKEIYERGFRDGWIWGED